MSSTIPAAAHPAVTQTPTLRAGDRLTRAEFHRIYELQPEHVRAELIEGIVYMPSPVSRRHSNPHKWILFAVTSYEVSTPGIETGNTASTFLNDANEPQPDVSLRVRPECGGRTQDTADGQYIVGPPELVIEVAHSTRRFDLHDKRAAYAAAGVQEYLVWTVREGQFHWFDLSQHEELPPPADGIVRSVQFAGLWLNAAAIAAEDHARLLTSVEAGLATPEHAAFAAKLAAAKGTGGSCES